MRFLFSVAGKRTTSLGAFLVVLLTLLPMHIPLVLGQASSSVTGIVSDPTGAPISSASLSVKNLETGAVRNAVTDETGRYQVLALPVGKYEVKSAKSGFTDATRSGIEPSVGQQASIDFHLQVGTVSTEIKVTGDAPIVNTTTRDISGVVAEQQVKELPLNGRSYDLLLPLNAGIVNFTSQKTGGTGIS